MNLSEISIKNPVFAWMLMLGLMFFGFLSFKGMGVGQMPDVDFPVLTITLRWEGAAPEVMETDVVDIIEDSVMGVQGPLQAKEMPASILNLISIGILTLRSKRYKAKFRKCSGGFPPTWIRRPL